MRCFIAGCVAVEMAFSVSLTLSSPVTAYLLDLRSLAQILAFFFNFCCIYYDCIFGVIFVIPLIIIVLLLWPLSLFVLPMPWHLCRRLAVCRSCSVIRAAFSRLGTNGWAPVGWLPGLLVLVPPFSHCLLHLALCWWKEMPFHLISWNDFSFRVIILSLPKWKVT